MLDRLLVPLLVAVTVTTAGVVGGDLLHWRLASAEVDRQETRVAAIGAYEPVPPAMTAPAPVRAAAVLQRRPVAPSVSAPVLRPRTTTVPSPEVTEVDERPLTARAPAPTSPSTSPPATTSTVSLTQANLRQGLSAGLFAQDLATVTSTAPDFITLNEAGHRSDAQIRPSGYTSYRATGSPYLAETPVLWRTDRWSAIDTGSRWLTTRKVKWGERAVNWVTLRSAGGQVVTVVSAHPAPTLRRTEGLLPVFVAGLGDLVRELSVSGPVLVGGDFNAGFGGSLYPRAGFAAAGLTPTYSLFGVPPGGTGDHVGATIDYVFYTSGLTPTAQDTRELSSDHDAVMASFVLGSA